MPTSPLNKCRRSAGRCLTLLVLTGSLAGVLPAATPVPGERRPELYEHAFDVRERSIPLNRRTPVDVNSELELRFVITPRNQVAAPIPADWQRLHDILQQVQSLAAKRNAINLAARQPAPGPTEVAALQVAARSFNREAVALLDTWEAALRPGESTGLQDVLTGDTEENGDPNAPYKNLAQWLTREIARLQAENQAALARHLVEVNVSAFLAHGSTAPKRIGVAGYDNIAAGSPDPISRFGLKMSEAEAAQFNARMQATGEVAGMLRQIQDDWASSNQSFAEALRSLSADIKNLPRELRGHVNTINSLGDLRTALVALSARPGLSEAQTQACTRVLAACERFTQDIQTLKDKVAALTQLYQTLRRGSDPAVIANLVNTLGQFRSAAKNLQAAAQQTTDLIRQWEETLQALAPDLQVVATLLATEQLAPLEDLRDNIEGTLQTLAPVIDTAKNLYALLGNPSGFDAIPQALAGVKIDENWFDPQLAPDARIALDSVGLVPGDRVQVKVSYRSPAGTRAPAPEVFTVETTRFGMYRTIDAALIFARPLKEVTVGEKLRWRPNAAATAHWFYRFRPLADGSLSAGKKTWNFINPGVGLHAASLAQGDDSVEVGMGANVSLLDGLVSGGYGYNLSTEKPYVFIGLGLMDVLEKARRPSLSSGSSAQP